MVTCNWTPHSEGGERSLGEDVHVFLGEHVRLLLVEHVEHVHLFLVKGRGPPAWLAVEHGGEDEQEEKSGKNHLQGLQEYIAFQPRHAKHIVLLYFSVLWMLKQMKLTIVSQAKTLCHFYEHPKLRQIEIQLWLELHPPSPEICSSLVVALQDFW